MALASLPGASKLAAEPRFIFETGDPPWRGERLVLPPDFAKDLGWIGVEQIRFSPGMFQAEAPDFFSYILVFLLEPESEVSEEALKREMLTYYRGLSQAVMGGKGLAVDTSNFSVVLNQNENSDDTKKGAPAAAPDSAAWIGTLDWIEPFATQKPQKLHFELHVWEHEGRPVVLSCVSPVEPDEGGPWEALRPIRSAFRFGQ